LKILKLQAENVKKLKAIEITPDGDVIKITGKNEQGKSTVLESILMALCGTKYVPEQPIHQGEKKANTVIYLGTNDCRQCEKDCKHPGYVKPADCPNIELIVTRSFTEAGSYLKVENRDGMGYKSPQKILDKIIGNITFDPLEFARSKSDKQVETLLKIDPIDIDIEKVQEIAQVEFEESDNPLETLKNAYTAIYQSRALVNKQLEIAKKTLEGMGEVEKTEPVSVTELVEEKERLAAENRENQRSRDAVQEKAKEILQMETEAAILRNEVERLKELLDRKQRQLDYDEKEIKRGKRSLEVCLKDLEKLQDNDLTDINARIANADEQNQKAKDYEKHQEHKTAFEQHEKDSKDHTKRLADIMAYKEELVSKANFPIPGLNFRGGGVEYLGLPFEQASGVQRLEVSLAVGMAMNPDLRVILIDEGSYVDSDHMKVIEKMAAEKGYQIWMVTGGEDKTVGVYIEDGMVANQEQVIESEVR